MNKHKRRIAGLAISACLTMIMSSTTLAAEPNMDLLNSGDGNVTCDGTAQLDLETTDTFGSSGGPTHVEFTNWDEGIQVDDYETILPAGTWRNIYALPGAVFEYGPNCTVDEVLKDHVFPHIERRSSKENKTLEYVDFESNGWVQDLFEYAGDVEPDPFDIDRTRDADSEPNTGINDGIVNYENECSDEAAEALAASNGVPLANRDVCNLLANATQWCGPFQDYSLVEHPELATAASYLVIKVTNLRDGDRAAILPHGRYGTDRTLEGDAWEFGVYCTYDQVLEWVHDNLSNVQLVDWWTINPIGLVTYQGDYRGGTVDPTSNVACHALSHKDIFEQLNGRVRIPREVTWISAQPWKDGTPEFETFFNVEDVRIVEFDRDVKGSVWYFAGNCSYQFMKANAKRSHFSRSGQYADNVHFDKVPNWDAYNSPIRDWFQLIR